MSHRCTCALFTRFGVEAERVRDRLAVHIVRGTFWHWRRHSCRCKRGFCLNWRLEIQFWARFTGRSVRPGLPPEFGKSGRRDACGAVSLGAVWPDAPGGGALGASRMNEANDFWRQFGHALVQKVTCRAAGAGGRRGVEQQPSLPMLVPGEHAAAECHSLVGELDADPTVRWGPLLGRRVLA